MAQNTPRTPEGQARSPVAQGCQWCPSFLSVGALLIFVLALAACLSSGQVRSAGAVLPQSPDVFDDSVIKGTLAHDCSDGWCKGFEVTLENLSESSVEIILASSRISRAGKAFPLALDGPKEGPKDGGPEGVIVIGPRQKKELKLRAFDPSLGSSDLVDRDGNARQPLSYPRPTHVWCSLKVDKACRNPSKGEALCAGLARTYYEEHTKAAGWISVKFAYKPAGGKMVAVTTERPQFLGDPPSVKLEEKSAAPRWSSDTQEKVVQRVECDERCSCSQVGEKRNFFLDDVFKSRP